MDFKTLVQGLEPYAFLELMHSCINRLGDLIKEIDILTDAECKLASVDRAKATAYTGVSPIKVKS